MNTLLSNQESTFNITAKPLLLVIRRRGGAHDALVRSEQTSPRQDCTHATHDLKFCFVQLFSDKVDTWTAPRVR